MNIQIKEMAEEAGMTNTLGCFWQSGDYQLERLVEIVDAAAVAREREACAKLCEGRFDEGLNFEGCAAVIRARGEK